MHINLVLKNEYSKEDIENAFDTNFGARIKGITLRKNGDQQYIIIFSTFRGSEMYGDRKEGDLFYYTGEGMDGDQKPTPANNALAAAVFDERPVFVFQQSINNKFQYLGMASVIDSAYVEQKGRKVFQYKIKLEGVQDPEEVERANLVLHTVSDLPEPILTVEDAKFKNVSIKARDKAFSDEVKKLYDYRCVVCGSRRFTATGRPEVEAAHIYPKEKNGSDDFRNGLSLCRFHHWAFDSGLFALNDDLTIRVNNKIKNDADYSGIYSFEGKEILKPRTVGYTPAHIYLEGHRVLHGLI